MIPGHIRDITARTQADAALYARNADLEHRVRDRTIQLNALNKALEMFNAAGSHDLHAPRRRIDSVIDALRDDSAERLEADGLQHIRHMEAATQRMHVLIDALLALSGVSRHALEWQVVDLRALAHVVAADLPHRQPPRQVDGVIADGLTAYGDPRLRHIVLDNLLSTAWKFTATTAQARLECGRQTALDGTSVVCVRENGAGCDMALVEKWFAAFQRLHRDTKCPGPGLGLATVQRLIHRHGGRLWAEGAVHQGATGSFTLPVVAPIDHPPQPRPPDPDRTIARWAPRQTPGMIREVRRTRVRPSRRSACRCDRGTPHTWRHSPPCRWPQRPSPGYNAGAYAGRRSSWRRGAAPCVRTG